MKLISSNCIAIGESLVPELEIEVKYCNIILKYTLNNNNFQILRLSPLDHLNYIYIYMLLLFHLLSSFLKSLA